MTDGAADEDRVGVIGIHQLVTVGASVLAVVAVRALYVGYPSFEPILFAELYLWLFGGIVFGIPLMLATARLTDGTLSLLALVLAACLAGATLGWAAPTIGEPNYCGGVFWGAGEGMPYYVDFRLPPKTFRCTSAPFAIAGLFGGWWLAVTLIGWWRSRGGNGE